MPPGNLFAHPMLSVVVTVVDGGETLARCLAALAAQVDPPELEVLVPMDATVGGIDRLRARFPAVRFLEMGVVATARPVATEAGRHELYDRRRAAGLAVARGEVVAMLEDRGVPRPDWARAVAHRHAALPHAAIGGAVENAVPRLINRAVWFCDFGRYALPLREGPSTWLSDVNVGPEQLLDNLRRLADPPESLEGELEVGSFLPHAQDHDFRLTLRRGTARAERPSLWPAG